jgi:pyrroline-5-carboxylate reductase
MTKPSVLLVGCGKMGGALLHGWLEQDQIEQAILIDPAGPGAFAAHPRVTILADRAALPRHFVPDCLVLAIKPQILNDVAPSYRYLAAAGSVVLSVAAGKTLAMLAELVGPAAAIVRAMPNLPASIACGVTVAVANAAVSAEACHLCNALLASVGAVEWIEDETWLDAVTALSGSGPAYVFLLIEAMAAAGAKAGLPADLALRLARATVRGAAALAEGADTDPAALRRAVTSPNGTTAAALDILMAPDGMQALFDRAIDAATRRAQALAG